MNPILALAIAIGTSSPLLERDLDLLHEPAKPANPMSQVDLDRMAAAQAKRERRALQKLKTTGQLDAYENRKFEDQLKFFSGFGNGLRYQPMPIVKVIVPS